MKEKRRNKALCASAALYAVAAGDVLINTFVAHRWFDGVPQVHPSVRVGALAVNAISVPAVSACATVLLGVGLWRGRRAGRE